VDSAIPAGGIAADFTRSKTGFRVQTNDLNILKTYYNKVDSAVPVCQASDYNFNTFP
jgi:hypothetical protein